MESDQINFIFQYGPPWDPHTSSISLGPIGQKNHQQQYDII